MAREKALETQGSLTRQLTTNTAKTAHELSFRGLVHIPQMWHHSNGPWVDEGHCASRATDKCATHLSVTDFDHIDCLESLVCPVEVIAIPIH